MSVSFALDADGLDDTKFNGPEYLDKWKRALEAKDRILLDCGLEGRITNDDEPEVKCL